MTNLQKQFKQLIKYPTMRRYLTKDLYESIHTQSGFIAHFNIDGFHNARFLRLNDFDITIDLMKKNRKFDSLFAVVSNDDLAQARFKVASFEAALLKKQAEIYLHHVEKLQSEFILKIV